MNKFIHTVKSWGKENVVCALLAFFIPSIILFAIYLSIGIYPGSDRSVLASDAFAQFSNFHASLNNVLHGKQSIFYTWNAGLGLNYLSLASYYLGGIFSPLVFFFPNENMPDALYFITLLKVGASGFTFWLLTKNVLKRHRNPWTVLAFTIPYPLMSFAMCQSELIMWLDAYVWLPLVVLGIRRLFDKNRSLLLFFSYFCLFISNFYFGYMIGIFTFLLFLMHLLSDWENKKHAILSYLTTSVLSVGASLFITLPVLLDLRENGETLTKILHLKTEDTALWDLIAKNFIGAYDGTKYGTVPYVYIGLIPLLFFFYYFVSRNQTIKEKVTAFFLVGILVASFYLEPLNLFWQGMHSPNMFLFRFAFLFSFIVIYLALICMRRFTTKEFPKLMGTMFAMTALFCLAYGTSNDHYTFLTNSIVITTFAFLLLYIAASWCFATMDVSVKVFAISLCLLMGMEATLNAHGMIDGILEDWNYASRSLYTEPHEKIQKLVDVAEKRNGKGDFYRLENLDPVSPNDSLNFDYKGVNFFSSIRNRHSSHFLDLIGFKSDGTNLNLRYDNNTLYGDALLSMKYNINGSDVRKYGFSKVASAQSLSLFENQNTLPLGFMTTEAVKSFQPIESDNLHNQNTLFNLLANEEEDDRFHFIPVTVDSLQNISVKKNVGGSVTYTEKMGEVAKVAHYSVTIPKNTQAYLSLFLTNPSEAGSSTAEIKVNGASTKSQMDITGQYYNIAYAKEKMTVHFTVEFYGSEAVSITEPKVLLVNTDIFKETLRKIKKHGAKVTVGKRTVTMKVDATKQYNTLYTTIPYDKGWQVSIDGKKETIEKMNDAFVGVAIPKGEHAVTFTFLPNGFAHGLCLSILSLLLYVGGVVFIRNKRHD